MVKAFVYLTAVVDMARRRVLAHKVAITQEACHAREVKTKAFARHGTSKIINTDQGSQCTEEEFTDVVLVKGCKLSIKERGSGRQNQLFSLLRHRQTSLDSGTDYNQAGLP